MDCPRCGSKLTTRRTKDNKEYWSAPVYLVEACSSAECNYWRSNFQVAYPQAWDAVIPNSTDLEGYSRKKKRWW